MSGSFRNQISVWSALKMSSQLAGARDMAERLIDVMKNCSRVRFSIRPISLTEHLYPIP